MCILYGKVYFFFVLVCTPLCFAKSLFLFLLVCTPLSFVKHLFCFLLFCTPLYFAKKLFLFLLVCTVYTSMSSSYSRLLLLGVPAYIRAPLSALINIHSLYLHVYIHWIWIHCIIIGYQLPWHSSSIPDLGRSVSESVTATLELRHKEWLLRLETTQTFDQSDV